MPFARLIEEYRGQTLENIHQGMICVVDEHKRVVYQRGDVEQPVYYRSALKPIQALPVFLTDLVHKYGLTDTEVALFMASQRGEKYHQSALESLMKKLKLSEEQLICPASYPLNETPKKDYIWDHNEPRKLLHNCAGKHLGFLAYAREMGYDLEGYDDENHPLQCDIRALLAELCHLDEKQIGHGIDGCGVPNYSVPLKNMALSYLNFSVPEQLNDIKIQEAMRHIDQVMHACPEIIASHDFICTELLRDSNIVAKGGAQGVYCLTLKREKLSIALKVLSGSENEWPLLVAEILKKLAYDNYETIDRLLLLRSHEIVNDGGKVVGKTNVLL